MADPITAQKNPPKHPRLPIIGGSSLLVIFSVLCLTVFALLSIATVRANGKLSQRTTTAIQQYYAAEHQAHEILSSLRAGQLPEGVTKEGDIYSYSCTMSKTRTLEIQVQVDGSDYKILRWQAVPSSSWEANDRLPVWDGTLQ